MQSDLLFRYLHDLNAIFSTFFLQFYIWSNACIQFAVEIPMSDGCWIITIIISIIQWIVFWFTSSVFPIFCRFHRIPLLLVIIITCIFSLSLTHFFRWNFPFNSLLFLVFVPISFRTHLESVFIPFNAECAIGRKMLCRRSICSSEKPKMDWKRIGSSLNGSNIQSLLQLANARLSKTRKMPFPEWNSTVLLVKFNFCSHFNKYFEFCIPSLNIWNAILFTKITNLAWWKIESGKLLSKPILNIN